MLLSCGKCGTEMRSSRERFWCDHCKAYFCPACVPASRKCPHCGRQRLSLEYVSRRNLAIFAGASIFVIAIMVAMALVLIVPNLGPTAITDIGEASPGSEVRLYGTINSTGDTAFVLNKVNGEWALLGYAEPFLLADNNDPEKNISVDINICREFEPDSRYSKGDAISTYFNGDRVTVVGKVIRNDTGSRVLVAEHLYEGRSVPVSPGTVVSSIAVILAVIGGTIAASDYLDRRKRRLFHEQFLKWRAAGPNKMEEPVERGEPHGYDDTDHGPVIRKLGEPLNVEWEPHSLYLKYRNGLVALQLICIPVIAATVFLWASGTGERYSVPVFILVILFGGFFVTWGVGTLFGYAFLDFIPKSVALTSKGAYFAYLSRRSTYIRVESAGWADISDIPNEETALAATGSTRHYTTIKVGGTTTYLNLDKDLQWRFIEDWHRYRPATVAQKQRAEQLKAKDASEAVKELDRKAQVEWMASDYSARNRRSSNRFVAAICIILVLLPLSFALFSDSAYLIALSMTMALVAIGAMILIVRIASDRRDLVAVGFSSEGLHFKYGKGKPREDEREFIPWTDIDHVSPAIGNYIQIFPCEMEKSLRPSGISGFYYLNFEPQLVQQVVREMDKRYERAHPEAAPPSAIPAVAESVPNRASSSAKRWVMLPVMCFVIGLVLAPLLYYFYRYFGLALGAIIIAISFCAIFQATPENYQRWKTAPESVGFSQAGLHLSYGRRPVPPGSASFISWEGIRKIVPRSEEEKLITGLGFRDTLGSTVLIATKKSGTTWVLGPFDAELAGRIRARVPAK